MSWWKFSTILALGAALVAGGCGSSASSAVAIMISPTSASVITNRTQLFSGLVTGNSNTAITWSITCATGVAANTCGSIDATGLYTAPATIPTVTTNGTTTIAPAVTVTATAQADTTKTSTATLTIITGISIAITPTTATVGTGEIFCSPPRSTIRDAIPPPIPLAKRNLVAVHYTHGNWHDRFHHRRLYRPHDGSLAQHGHHHSHFDGRYFSDGDGDGHVVTARIPR